MLSFGMLAALAARTAVRSRGLKLGSPLLPIRAATVISLISLVNILPRLASLAAFLCLMVLHFEWPDMCCYPRRSDANRAREASSSIAPRRAKPRAEAVSCSSGRARPLHDRITHPLVRLAPQQSINRSLGVRTHSDRGRADVRSFLRLR